MPLKGERGWINVILINVKMKYLDMLNDDEQAVVIGEIFGHIYIIGPDPSLSKSSRLHICCDDLPVFL